MPNNRSFLIVALATLFLLMGTNTYTLYGLYKITFALSPLAITLIYAAYSVGVVPTLFFFGPIS